MGCTDVRCPTLSDEEVPASGCLYMTYQDFLLHDEIIRGPSVRRIMLQVSCNSITLNNKNETFGLICIRIFLRFIVNILFLIFIIHSVHVGANFNAQWRTQSV